MLPSVEFVENNQIKKGRNQSKIKGKQSREKGVVKGAEEWT